MNELIVKIRFLLPSLPRAERDFAKALLENPKGLNGRTLSEVAKNAGSSEAAVIRFCKRMGFDGYTSLKNAFQKAENEDTVEVHAVDGDDDVQDILQKVYLSNLQTLQNTMVLSNDGYEKAINALVQAGAVHFFGVGDANAACQFMYIKLQKLGIPCSAHSDVMLQYIAAENMNPGDVAVAVSYEGHSVNINQAMKRAKSRGAVTVAITRRNKSPMLKYIDIPIFVSVCDLTVGWEKATRRIAEQFVLEVLYMGFMARSRRAFDSQLERVQQAIDENKE